MPSFPKLSTSLEQGRPHSRLRLLGLLAVVILAVLLPLAGASAGPLGDTSAEDSRNSGELPTGDAGRVSSADEVDDKPGTSDPADTAASDTAASDTAGKARRSHERPPGATALAGLGIATKARCGPELASPDGIEAQTCVLTQGRDTWARTYYRNATGGPLSSVLSLMAPGGRTVQMHCAVGAQDEPGTCDTPRERTSGEVSDYSAVAEFAGAGDAGPLLLRSGSNASTPAGR
ncbi:hypothetical protein [Streptomyces sp. AcE210]|uniref:hypothetical protein n=1 Tax=Streptomyces sp. AcE210 TaxID=2292703 RepID=UPI000E30B0C9|nr:hypothetical protein [Streptomyces sp. AcE210]RFC73447.1 hypothetical protein DXZ75_42390 [Streptomyces sp. AcE210]